MPGRGVFWKVSGNNKRGVVFEQLTASLQQQITGGGAHTGHVIENEFTPLASRPALNFTGAGVVASDDGERTNVNIPGGGGGGGEFSTLDQFVWFDEMLYNALSAITDHYATLGSINPTDGGSQARVEIDTNGALGATSQLHLEGICPLDFFSGDDITYETKIGNFGEEGESVLFMGLSRAITGNDATISESRLETNNTDMCGFIADPAISNNWRLITRSGGVSTVTQTTINAYSTHKLKWFFDKVAGTVEFFIDGVSRGVHSTNIPAEDAMIPQISIWQTVASGQTMIIFYFKLIQPRP